MSDPPEPELADFLTLFGVAYAAARRAYDAEHGTLVSAPSGWVIATYVDNAVRYLAVAAFVVGPGGALRTAVTVENYVLKFSALCDPASGRYVSVMNGKAFATEADWLAEMRALRQFEAETPAGEATVAH